MKLIPSLLTTVVLLVTGLNCHAAILFGPNSTTLTTGGNQLPVWTIDGACGGGNCSHVEISIGGATNGGAPAGSSYIGYEMRVSGRFPNGVAWNTAYNNLYYSNNYYPDKDIISWRDAGATQVCAWARTTLRDHVILPYCTPIGAVSTPTTCQFNLPSTLDYGVVPSTATNIYGTVSGSITCNADATLTIRAGNNNLSQSRISLSPNNDAFANLDLNGSNALPGQRVSARRNTPVSIVLGSTLELLPNVQAGRYTGSAVVLVDWP